MDKADPLSEEENGEEEEAEAEVEAEATCCQIKNCKQNPYRGTECRDTKSQEGGAMLDTSMPT